MIHSVVNRKRWILLLIWIIVFPVIYIGTKLLKTLPVNAEAVVILGILLLSLVLSLLFLLKKNEYIGVSGQLFLCVLVLTVFWDSALLSQYTEKGNKIIIALGTIFINSAVILLYIKLFGNFKLYLRKIIRWMRKEWPMLIIVALFTAGAIISIDSWLSAGAYDYFCSINYAARWNMTSLSILRVCGHDSQSFSFFLLIGQFIFGKGVWSARLMLILMADVTIICFNLFLKKFMPAISVLLRILFVSMFAFSPLLYGMIEETVPDYCTLFFFVWMMTAMIYNQKILEGVFAILLCFSKETGVVLYLTYLAGIVLFKLCHCKKKNIISKISYAIINREVIVNCVAGWLYIVIFLLRETTVWTGGTETVASSLTERTYNTIRFDFWYIVYKCRQMLTPNFLWIYIGAIGVTFILCIVRWVVHKKRKQSAKLKYINSQEFWCMITACVGYLMLSFLYITWTNYRYTISSLFFICVFFDIVIVWLMNEKNRKWIFGGVSVLLVLTIASNYVTLDRVFGPRYTYDIGKDRLLNNLYFYSGENNNMLVDELVGKFGSVSPVYNREYVYIGKTIEKALQQIEYDDDTLVLLPNIMGEYVTYTSYYGRRKEEGNGPHTLYWNQKEGILTVNSGYVSYEDNPEYEKYTTGIIYSNEQLEEFRYTKAYKRVFVMELPFGKNRDISYEECAKNITQYSYGLCELTLYQIK